jgi:hypothetical protein
MSRHKTCLLLKYHAIGVNARAVGANIVDTTIDRFAEN